MRTYYQIATDLNIDGLVRDMAMMLHEGLRQDQAIVDLNRKFRLTEKDATLVYNEVWNLTV